MAHIKIIDGFNRGVTMKLMGDTIVGRAPTSALCLPDQRASREHALIKPDGDGFTITDLGSVNGTYVNGTLLADNAPRRLEDGDEILICSTSMKFSAVDDGLSIVDYQADGEVPSPSQAEAPTKMESPVTASSSDKFLDAEQDMAALREGEEGSPMQVVRRLQAMLKVSSVITHAGERDVMLDQVLDCVLATFPGAERVFLLLPDAATGQMLPRLGRFADPNEADKNILAISRTATSMVVEKKRSLLSVDAKEDFGVSQSIVDLSICSMMCAPLMLKGEILGVITVDTRKVTGQFNDADLLVLTGIAQQMAMAVKNADLDEKVTRITRLANTLNIEDPSK